MNFAVKTVNGIGVQTWDLATDITTNIWYSLNIAYGSWWQQPTFGHRLNTIKKITDSNILLAKQYVEEALNWILLVGRAKTITVVVEQDNDKPYQMNIKVTATQPDNLIISYTQFYSVV